MGSVTEQLSLTFSLEQFPRESCTRTAHGDWVSNAPDTTFYSRNQARKGQSEQRPEAQEWAEACGQEGQVTQRILVLLRAKRKRRGKLCGSGIEH